MKNLFILMFVFILVMGFASAEVRTFGTFKAGECIRLVQYPSDATYTDIVSIIGPNSFNYTSRIAMNNTPGTNEYYHNFCTDFSLGKYIVNGISDEGGVDTAWAYDFNITSSGSQYGIYLLIFLLLISVILFIFAFRESNPYFGFIAGSTFILSGIFLMINGLDVMINDFTRGLAYVVLGFGLITIFAAVYEMFDPDFERDEDD